MTANTQTEDHEAIYTPPHAAVSPPLSSPTIPQHSTMIPQTLSALPSSFNYNAWEIRYSLTSNSNTASAACRTVVFVHGTPWSSIVFQPLVEALLATRNFRILLYDLAGYGQSQHYSKHSEAMTTGAGGLFEGDTSVKTQAGALAALLAHLELSAPAVIAHDIAGSIVLRAHLLHNVALASLLLMDTNAVLPWGDGFYTLARSNPQVFLDLPPGIFEAVVRAVIRSASASPETLSERWVDLLAEPWLSDGGQKSFVRQIAQANDSHVAEMLREDSRTSLYGSVACPVKILWGSHDSWIPRDKMVQLESMLPPDRAKGFVEIAEAGHLVMVDQPERVADEVMKWLDLGSP